VREELVAMKHSSQLLELENVTVKRGMRRILDRVSVSIPMAQHTAILGPNGSGKSSLLKLLIRQFYPSIDENQSGMVRILGESVWNVSELRKNLGIVSGELDHEFASPRSGRMTGLQAVLSGLDGVKLVSGIAHIDKTSIEAARMALSRFGATQLENQTLATMSTGERRRVLISRALIHQPKALVLDEPTTGLDIAARHRFLVHLQELAQSGTTIILVTHHVEEMIPAIGHVIFLKEGRTSRTGTVDELIRDQPLTDLFDFPVTVERSIPDSRYLIYAV